ncbi:SLOG family protein [Streptomyces sp. NPDC055254]
MTAPYRILVTGSRDWPTPEVITAALDEEYALTPADRDVILVHGGCPTGADAIAHTWAGKHPAISIDIFLAQWDTQGRAAGPIRNARMVAAGADVCLAFIKNGSRGATHAARLADRAGIPTRRWTT